MLQQVSTWYLTFPDSKVRPLSTCSKLSKLMEPFSFLAVLSGNQHKLKGVSDSPIEGINHSVLKGIVRGSDPYWTGSGCDLLRWVPMDPDPERTKQSAPAICSTSVSAINIFSSRMVKMDFIIKYATYQLSRLIPDLDLMVKVSDL